MGTGRPEPWRELSCAAHRPLSMPDPGERARSASGRRGRTQRRWRGGCDNAARVLAGGGMRVSWGTQGWRPGCKRSVATRAAAKREPEMAERHFRLRGASRSFTRTRTLSTRRRRGRGRGQWQALRRLWIRPEALIRRAQWLLRYGRLPDPRMQGQEQLLQSQLGREAGWGTRWPGSAGTARPRILRRTDL